MEAEVVLGLQALVRVRRVLQSTPYTGGLPVCRSKNRAGLYGRPVQGQQLIRIGPGGYDS